MAQPSLLYRLAFGGLFLIGGFGMVLASARRLRKAGAVVRTRPSSVADLSPGDLATVEGRAVPLSEDRVPAHFLGGEGVAVATRVERSSSTGTGGPPGAGGSVDTWTTEHYGFDAVPFAVEDDTGRIAVDPPEAEEFPAESSFRESIRLDGTTVRDRAVRSSTAAAYDEYVGDEVADVPADRRFEQAVLEPGETVTVMGRVIRRDDGGLAIGSRRNPDAFTLATESRPSALGQFVVGVVLGLIGLPVAAIGAGVILLPLLPGWVNPL